MELERVNNNLRNSAKVFQKRLDFCGRLRILESAISAIAQIGGENMRNLIAEMSRSGVRTSDIMSVLNIAERTAQYKVSGKSQFTVCEAFRVRDALFPGLRLEYLFCPDEAATQQSTEAS